MPSGKVHHAITAGLIGASLPVAMLWAPALAVTAGIATGLLVDPDLDCRCVTYAGRRLLRCNRPLGVAWRLFWWPYLKLARHRGRSHAPLVGTLGRALYVAAPAAVALAVAGVRLPWSWVALWFGGLALADLAHIGADVLSGRCLHRGWRR